jgi:flagellin
VSLSILNNVAALYAQNSLTSTQAKLQSTLQQLSSGSRISSGADDPAGLSVADGLGGNQAALSQSAKNADSGIGLLQTADGALSQVTNLLDRATTLATEAANGTLTATQISSANQEYQNILAQIGHIGSATNFNSLQVFTNAATNIVVTDGTSSGLSVYSDTVGVLSQASVGATAATVTLGAFIPGTASQAGIVDTGPIAGVSNSAGQYSFTAGASTDTLAGTISFNIGGGTQQNISVVAGSSLGTVSRQLTTAGFANTVSNNVIDITGPVTGADAAANTVNFSGTSLTFTPGATNLASGSYGTIVTPARLSMATLSLAGIPGNSTPPDTFGGTIIVSQTGQTSVTVNIVAGSHLGPIANTGTVEYQIAQQLLGSAYALTASDGNDADPVLHFSGASGNSSPVAATVGTFADTSRSGVTFTAASPSNASPQITQNTYTLSALASSADSFGSSAGNANTLNINGTNLSIANMTATQAGLAINGLSLSGITASVSTDGTTLIIDGNPSGGALSILGYNGGALALTDQPPADWLTGNAIGTPANMGQSGSGTLTFSGANSGDQFGGSFTLSQGSSQLSINITPGSNLMSMENQIEEQSMSGAFFVMPYGGTPSDPVFSIEGSNSATPITYTAGSFADSTTPSATFTGVGVSGTPGTPGTYNLAALNSSSDTFGSGAGNANMLDIDGAEISIAGMTATLAAQAINGNFNMQSYGISASVNAAGTQVTLLGNAYGETFAVSGYGGTALALADESQYDIPAATVLGAGSSTPTIAGSETISTMTFGAGAKMGDPLTGSITIQIGSAPAQTMNLAANTTLDYNETTGIGMQLDEDLAALGLGDDHNGAMVTDVSGTPTLSIYGQDDVSTSINFSAGTVVDPAQSNYYSMNFVSFGTTDPDVPAQSTLTLGDSSVGDNPSVGDTISGTFDWGQNSIPDTDTDWGPDSVTGSVVLTAGTTLTDSTTDPNSITYQLNQDSGFHTAGLTASLSGTNIVVTATGGALGAISLDPNGPLLDVTTASNSVDNDSHIGGPYVPNSYTLAALGSSSDTFGTGTNNANTLDINGTNISVAGMTANQAMKVINDNTTLSGQGTSAKVNGAGTQLTVFGDSSILGYNGGAFALTDQAPRVVPAYTIAQTVAPNTTSQSGVGTSVITMGHSTDTLSGPLSVVVNGHTAAVTVAANTTGLELQDQINGDSTFQAASLSAFYNSANATITITGPPGGTLDTTATLLTDTTAPTQTIAGIKPGAGADFTAASVSQLSAATATTVLTTITSAIADVAYQRGTLGADINQLTSASNVASAESVNLLSAQNSVLATDYGQAASNLSKYQILSQMGISALAQANSVQQEVLKLLQ